MIILNWLRSGEWGISTFLQFFWRQFDDISMLFGTGSVWTGHYYRGCLPSTCKPPTCEDKKHKRPSAPLRVTFCNEAAAWNVIKEPCHRSRNWANHFWARNFCIIGHNRSIGAHKVRWETHIGTIRSVSHVRRLAPRSWSAGCERDYG